jgi:5-oxoprolinase (ATP-hydrolysing) subunit A
VNAGPSVIDLNADLGESFGAWRLGDDEALLEIVTSANIACGFHAGDPLTIRRACAGAVAHGVSIGAQVSYHDLAGFGRREMSVPPEELTAEILYQIAALDGAASPPGRVSSGRAGS